uniref:DUF4794 domain-containing protein n=1 Tax=Anopheles dirus TaxID=7168 RepID=A0A182NT86_9DIPT
MRFTLGLAITVALVASLCTASPLLVTKHVVKKLVASHRAPKTVTHAVVYTPVVAPHPPVLSPSPHVLETVGPALHAKLSSTFGSLTSLLKLPLLDHPLLAKLTPGGVVEVYRKHRPSTAPYPPHVEVEEHHTVVPVPPVPLPVPLPEPVPVPPPVYGVPAATYGLPATSESSSSHSSSSGSASSVETSGAKYVAVNLGARHEAPLPGYDHSVVLENLEPAPGTEGLTMLVPPVLSNELTNWNAEPVVLRGQDVLSHEYLRTGDAGGSPPADGEARYVAINNGVRHEAPLPGYERSVVIENLDTV